jgi:hypothetical protein
MDHSGPNLTWLQKHVCKLFVLLTPLSGTELVAPLLNGWVIKPFITRGVDGASGEGRRYPPRWPSLAGSVQSAVWRQTLAANLLWMR